MIHYAPSSAGLRTSSGGTVVGQFATLAIGLVVFQVFTVDYVGAEAQQAEIWNTDPPQTIAHTLPLIWPHRLRAGDVPLAAFPHNDFERLVNWDTALLRGIDP